MEDMARIIVPSISEAKDIVVVNREESGKINAARMKKRDR
jgi:hypothetical protein